MVENKKRKEAPEVYFIPAGILVGLGIGFFVDEIVGGLLLGLGLGFLAVAIIRLMKNSGK